MGYETSTRLCDGQALTHMLAIQVIRMTHQMSTTTIFIHQTGKQIQGIATAIPPVAEQNNVTISLFLSQVMYSCFSFSCIVIVCPQNRAL